MESVINQNTSLINCFQIGELQGIQHALDVIILESYPSKELREAYRTCHSYQNTELVWGDRCLDCLEQMSLSRLSGNLKPGFLHTSPMF